MSKVNDFCIVGELGLLVTACSDKFLRIFKLEVKQEGEVKSMTEVGQVHLVSTSSFQKESSHRGIQCEYDRKRNLLLVLSADNQLEIFKVNVSKPKTILKKLVRAEKKKALKRTHKQFAAAQQQNSSGDDADQASDDNNGELGKPSEPIKRSVDKAALERSIEERDYNMALHFTRRLTVPLDPSSKARAFTTIKKQS